MALRASATATLPLPPPPSSPSSPPKTFSITKTTYKSPPRPTVPPFPASATLSLIALLAAPQHAKALTIPKERIVSSLTQVENTIDQVQEVGSSFFNVAGRVIQAVTGAVKPVIDVASPILEKAGKEAVKLTSPAISEASKKAQEAIQSFGFDTEPVINVAKTVAGAAQQTTTVIEKAKPIASSTVETILSADPLAIVGTGGAFFVAYLLFPPIFSAISFNLRGYKGDLTPAQTLDLMSTKNYITVDIRSEKEKDKAGVPRLPSSAKNKMLAIPLEELPSKLRGIVRNVKKTEAELAAVKISYLKKIKKDSNIVIMCSYSDSAKMVARVLTSLGFTNCWIMDDGFSGSRGWLQSRLGADTYNISFADVISPSQVISPDRRFGATSSAKLLPGGSD